MEYYHPNLLRNLSIQLLLPETRETPSITSFSRTGTFNSYFEILDHTSSFNAVMASVSDSVFIIPIIDSRTPSLALKPEPLPISPWKLPACILRHSPARMKPPPQLPTSPTSFSIVNPYVTFRSLTRNPNTNTTIKCPTHFLANNSPSILYRSSKS